MEHGWRWARATGLGCLLVAAGPVAVPAEPLPVAAEQSLVVAVRDPRAVDGLEVDAPRARAMVNRGVRALTGQPDERAAWASLVGSNDVVGIKLNCQAAPLLAPHAAVVEAIAAGLRSAGLPATNIVVWARDPNKLREAGYPPGPAANGLYRVAAVVEGDGWDPARYYQSKLAGKLIWGDLLFGREEAETLAARSHLPRLLTETLTKLINVPVLQDHDGTGLAGCLYNLSIATVDNARRFELYSRGVPEVAEIIDRPEIRRKLVLNLLDGLVAGFAGGPAFKPRYSCSPATLYLSRDPVAVDAVALQFVEARRAEASVPAIGRNANHIAAAAVLGLGQADKDKIELRELAP